MGEKIQILHDFSRTSIFKILEKVTKYGACCFYSTFEERRSTLIPGLSKVNKTNRG